MWRRMPEARWFRLNMVVDLDVMESLVVFGNKLFTRNLGKLLLFFQRGKCHAKNTRRGSDLFSLKHSQIKSPATPTHYAQALQPNLKNRTVKSSHSNPAPTSSGHVT